MRYESRAELEAIGRVGAKAIETEDYYLCRVLSSFWVAISKDDNGLMPHIKDGFWEPWIMLWMSQNVKPTQLVADIGANIGFYTFFLAEHGCVVDSYEPNPVVFNNLQRALSENAHIRDAIEIYQLAVSKEGLPLHFSVPYNNPMNGGNSSLMHEPVDGYDEYEVQSTNTLKHQAYDFIKIDVEGGEIEIFELLDPEKHPLVLMEFRWDRYSNPEQFAIDVFNKYPQVSEVTFDGSEVPLENPKQLETRKNADWMLVLRVDR